MFVDDRDSWLVSCALYHTEYVDVTGGEGRSYLGVSADGRLAVLARVGEQRLVTLDAERLLVSEDVPVARQVQVTVETSEHGRVRLHDDVTTGWSLRHAQPTRADQRQTVTNGQNDVSRRFGSCGGCCWWSLHAAL